MDEIILNPLDSKFPRDLVVISYKIESFINKRLKVKSYRINFCPTYGEFFIILNFEYFCIKINFNYIDIINMNIEDIYTYILGNVKNYIMNLYFK